jgi:sucrose phosphorylase
MGKEAHHGLAPAIQERIASHLAFLYGPARSSGLLERVMALAAAFQAQPSAAPPAPPLSHQDVMLITYGDQFRRPGELPLETLRHFLKSYALPYIRGVHILPFFPYSSDDGFSVIDYRQVNPALGRWEHVHAIASEMRLMVDAVINHVSAQSAWFQAFLQGDPRYRDYFIVVDPQTDLSRVVRPRDLPLLTPFQVGGKTLHLWTTFSADQIDLNYANPQVLLEMLDLLLFYVRNGASIIRLDATAFLWKEVGTPCIHLPQTHRVVKLMRALLDALAPHVYLITETNVPQRENISYFGDGTDEAHLVYQFALPPLVLDALVRGQADILSRWAASLELPSEGVTFFNFTASHDGIGLRPAEGLLPARAIQALVERTVAHGGGVSYRALPHGGQQPYELNINYFDALNPPEEVARQPQRALARFLASQAIMLSMRGLPAVYIHSLIGSRNDPQGVERTGMLRAINRQKLEYEPLQRELADPTSLRHRVYHGYRRLLEARQNHPAFHPYGPQQVLPCPPGVFALLRQAPDGRRRALAIIEVSGQRQEFSLTLPDRPTAQPYDWLNGEALDLDALPLAPYQVRWIDLDGGAPR